MRCIESAARHKKLRDLNSSLQSRLDAHGPGTRLIGNAKCMVQVRGLIDNIAKSSSTVPIIGESGTGKELAARSLHANSPRCKAPFVTTNCAAISTTLIESELFGHQRGAFTSAIAARKGLVEAADGGTLFLDEIGDVPMEVQVNLLRVLQEGEIRPVGATKSRKVDVRVVAATNVDLDKAMQSRAFRSDLYYRLSTFKLVLPP